MKSIICNKKSLITSIRRKIKFVRNLIVIFIISQLLHGCNSIQSGRILSIKDGYDWTLPETVKPTPFTGWARADNYSDEWDLLYPVNLNNPDEIYYHQVIGFNWAEVNPEKGVFDWSLIDSAINNIEQKPNTCFSLLPGIWSKKSIRKGIQGYPYGGYHDMTATTTYGTNFLRFRYSMIPEWVNTEYLSTGLAAAWDPDPENQYFEALEEFIDALSKRYKNHPRFGWVHCPFLDYAWGEGCFRAPRNTDRTERENYVRSAINETNLTPENLDKYLNTLVDIYADAFAGKEGRIVWTSVENEMGPLAIFGGEEYNEAKKRAWKYAISKGFGGRDGQIEVWMRYLTEGYGNVVDSNGYLVMDENYPPVNNKVIWYTENENWTSHFAPDDSTLFYIYKTRVMRLLQMRRNWDWGGIQKALVFPELGRYEQLSLGKTIENSQDAWCWPRESYVNTEGIVIPVKNFERWLYQRDINPGGMTKPAERTDISRFNQEASVSGFEFEARSTDVLSGNNCMFFDIDERWFKESGPCKLLITFLDNSDSQWNVEYYTRRGSARTKRISQEKTGKIKTATIQIHNITATGESGNNMDLKIETLNNENITVLLFRIIKD